MENEKLNNILKLGKECAKICDTIALYQKKKKEIEDQIKSILPKGYFYACDIDSHWHRPKKYSIKNVSCDASSNIILVVKEAFKKKPWADFTGEHYYTVQDFFNLTTYKTAQEAMNRPCSKCGGPMGNATGVWCEACMIKRRLAMQTFGHNYFYDPKENHIVVIEYEDELIPPSVKGYGGMSFTMRRLDTNEILHTTNLQSVGYGPNVNNYPEVEFIK